jgi:FG-GAP-like repeat/FG-GAP repeat
MRIKSAVLILLLVPVLVLASTSWFGDYEILLNNVIEGRDVEAADFDGDGDDDIAVTARGGGSGNVSLLVNLGGEFVSVVVDPNFNGATDAEVADMDGDGDLDLVVSGSSNIRWYRNNGGLSFTEETVTGAFDECIGLDLIDMDGDGDIDVAATSYADDRVGWIENDGSGNFSNHIITYDCDGATAVNGIDLDLDGDMDLVATSNISDQLLWYVNDGAMEFTAQVIGSDLDGARGLATGDFQGDGLTDITVAVNGNDLYVIFSNNGDGTFVETELEYMAPGAWDVKMFDVDSDGDDDIFGFCQYDHDPRWYEYDANNRYMEHTLDSDLLGFFSLTFGNFNGDGIPDAAGMRYSPDNQNEVLSWLGNRNDEWTERPVDESIWGANDAKAADLDNDGDMDIVGAANTADKLFGYKNLGNNIYQKHLIADFEGVYAIHITNMDDISVPDILVASAFSNSIRLYRNFGNMEFVQIHIDVDLTQAQSVHGVDVDGDGDKDVIGAGHGNNDVVWYDFHDNFYQKIIVDGDLLGASDVVGVDLDQDGDVDILACGQLEDRVVWYENNGAESFTRHTVASQMDGVKAAFPADFDGDGDLDVAGVLYAANEVVWWENNGAMSFTTHLVASDFTQAYDIYVRDIDGDGSPDMAASSYGDDTIAWFQNDGSGNFTMHVIDGDFEGPRGLQVRDLDGDGRMDLVAAANRESQIGWWENLFGDPPDDLTLNIQPNDDPVEIPAEGGTFSYLAQIERDGPVQTRDAWTTVTHVPTTNSVITNEFIGLTIPSGTRLFSLSQTIPAMAPEGEYTFGAFIGVFPWVVETSDVFTFSKDGVLASDYSIFDQPEQWSAAGSMGEQSDYHILNSEDNELPSEYALGDAYPNPFNPSTRIVFTLPETAFLQLTVYNALGQQVAELANGKLSAGVHEFTFSAADHPSGLYFIRAAVPGQFSDVKKVMLLK